MKKYNITVNGNTYDVEVEELKSEGVSVSREKIKPQSTPRPQVSKSVSSKTQASPQSGGGSGSVNAPMPGTINDVRVKVGDSVKKGQILLILEAMKMENEIMASCDGTISGVSVSKGASVSAGDVLVTIA
ncbi:biotin/lipoyl-binding protein [Clostridium sp. CCUG 7971]|nr:biotin/lipoyl-binding protein [Clostridium sp. CCUG 7971]